jgi:hypothetical protein
MGYGMTRNDNGERLVWTWMKMAVTDCNNLKQRIIINNICFFFGVTAPQWAWASSFTRFLDHTQRRTTVGRTPLDE